MKFSSLSLRTLLIASTAILAPAFASAQTENTSDTSPEAAAPEAQDLQLQEVVVLGRYIPEVLRSTSEVAAFLAPEDLARQGDSDAASALARVTGITIAEGRFVYVRGLGERYSAARLNGSPLPSPEPLQRVVPLDLFPTNILENVLVQKTYSVEYPGEFGGGIVDLRTLNIPKERFLELSVSGSYNTETTGKDGITHYGADSDVLGFDDGTRKIPGLVRQAMATGNRIQNNNFTDAELQAMGQAFTNAPINLIQTNDSIPMNGSYEASAGTSFDLGGAELGIIGVLGYSNDWRTRNGRQEVGEINGGILSATSTYDYLTTEQNIGWDGLFGVGLDFGDDKFNWTNLYIRRTTKQTSIREGYDDLASRDVRDDRTGWYARELYSTQINGDHYRGPWTLDWRAALSQTKRDAPYERATRFIFSEITNSYIYDPSGSGSSNSTTFSYLDDKVVSGGADVKYVQSLSSARDIEYSAGVEAYQNDRSAQSRIFSFIVGNPPLDFLVSQQRPDFLFANYNINPDLFVLREITGSSGAAAYDADLKVFGAYAKVDAEIIPLVRTAVGVRFEDATQSVTPLSLIASETAPEAPPELENQYLLPAATLTWNFAEDQQLRLGASKSIGRPQFRELAPQQYYDPESGRTFIGNPYLTDTEILNLDARYELYFDRGQAVTAGVFFKQLDRPVEAVVVQQSASVFQTYLNAPEAILYGAEIDFKRVFDSPIKGAFFDSKEFLVQANYTYTTSEVKAGSGDVVYPLQAGGQPRPATDFIIDGTRLQGQSEHIANLQIGWEDEAARSQLTLLANYASERVTARAPAGQPDFLQDPGINLDLVYKKGFDLRGKAFTLDIKAKNLLKEDFEEYQTGNDGYVRVNQYDVGTTLSVGLSAAF
ncbi:TonB-dependent receptor [Hyphomonas polymorpha PS728]|uniref:TonB-dependent receptor n=1 Tax=Hyphomonas polymorpha PS728 TaxID=1280954 RepID=A0A062VAB8_9PROT|nr:MULTISPECIES: TonB-dependent receptor [Hyphomonas]AXE64292.1 TonB-dependent receptor [Hyphomonas sp. CACIAM 19H1]KCZ99274.1 TonB-dependent receptor [Hyphomonas polymorpha PS728]